VSISSAIPRAAWCARYFIKYLGGVDKIDSLVNLAAVNYGTAVANVAKLLGVGAASYRVVSADVDRL
jgi:triacylglycerol esterase/lipase EstA (alpha/beta hydrolase family)